MQRLGRGRRIRRGRHQRNGEVSWSALSRTFRILSNAVFPPAVGLFLFYLTERCLHCLAPCRPNIRRKAYADNAAAAFQNRRQVEGERLPPLPAARQPAPRDGDYFQR